MKQESWWGKNHRDEFRSNQKESGMSGMFLLKGLINQYTLTVYASVAHFGEFQMIFEAII